MTDFIRISQICEINIKSLYDLLIYQLSKFIPLRSKNIKYFEFTFVYPRYNLGGYPPSQTTPQALSAIIPYNIKLKKNYEWYFMNVRVTPTYAKTAFFFD